MIEIICKVFVCIALPVAFVLTRRSYIEGKRRMERIRNKKTPLE